LSWDPPSGQRDSLSFSLRTSGEEESRRVHASLDNSYVHDLTEVVMGWVDPEGREGTRYPSVMLRADVAADYQWIEETPSLTGSVVARADIALSPTWSVALSTSYLTGAKTSGEVYHSVLFEATFAISF
jgi:hypothetical protein